jgi:hypothetical protein
MTYDDEDGTSFGATFRNGSIDWIDGILRSKSLIKEAILKIIHLHFIRLFNSIIEIGNLDKYFKLKKIRNCGRVNNHPPSSKFGQTNFILNGLKCRLRALRNHQFVTDKAVIQLYIMQ